MGESNKATGEDGKQEEREETAGKIEHGRTAKGKAGEAG